MQSIKMQNETVRPESYRTCTDYREILRIFQKSSNSLENFLWQADSFGKNVITPQHMEIDFVSRGIVVHFSFQKFDLDPELPLYVKLDYRSTVFKITKFKLGLGTIHFSFPELMKTLELRSEKRVLFNNQDKVLSLRPSQTSLPHDSGSEIQVRLADICSRGAGIMVSEVNRSFLKNNKFLWITRINEQKLYEPIMAEVVYMTSDVDNKFYKRRQRELKVGLRLSAPVPSAIFQKLVH